MSDNIPLEIQMEIIQRIPHIKSVIQFRAVSKAWKSIIDSKEFVTGHTLRHIQQQPRHLLIRGKDYGDPQNEVKYVSVVDDDTFPHQKFNLFVPDFCKYAKLVGSSHGLFCLYDDNRKMVVIWNPTIRKTVVVPYEVGGWNWNNVVRNDVVFGVCDNTLDPKIVKMTKNADHSTRAEVFTLSLGAWRSPLSNTSPHKSISFGWFQAVVDGFIYWDAFDTMEVDGVCTYPSLIMSFNMTSEEFTELYLPNPPHGSLSVSNLRESLRVFEFDCYTYINNVNVWIMKGSDCEISFEKLYHISPSDASSMRMPMGFRWSGAPIVEMENERRDSCVALAAYELESNDITEIWSNGVTGLFRVHSYMETLLLLDH